MRILQLMNRVPWPLKDGGSLGYFNFTKGYAQAGCEVTIAALNTSKHYIQPELLPTHVQQLANWHTVYCDNRVKPFDAFVNLFSNQSYNITRFDVPEYHQLLKDLLQSQTFDVIIFESLFMAPYLKTVRQYSKVPCVLREHNVEYKIWETLSQTASNPIKKIYLNILAKRLKAYETTMLNQFDGLTTVTANDAEQLKAMGCIKPMEVAPFGIFLETNIHSKQPSNTPKFFHLGSMEWLPNQQAMEWFLENVWPILSQKYPQAVFYLAGRGMPSHFNKYANQQVVITGEVEDAGLFMEDKDVMVVPLFSGSGIRVKILEGMAMQKAVITTSLGVQGIDAKNGKQVLVANDVNQFIEAAELMMNTNFAHQMGQEAAKLIANQYDINKIVQRLLLYYKHLKANA